MALAKRSGEPNVAREMHRSMRSGSRIGVGWVPTTRSSQSCRHAARREIDAVMKNEHVHPARTDDHVTCRTTFIDSRHLSLRGRVRCGARVRA